MPSDFRILGPVEVVVGGTHVLVGGPKTQVLLITLLLQTGRVSLGRLAEALWDDQPPASAIANLRTYAAELRGRLAAGDDVRLVTRDGGYALDLGPSTVDSAVFTGLAASGRSALEQENAALAVLLFDQALDMWRGRAGEGLRCGRSLGARLAVLNDQRWAAMEHRAQARIALGDHVTAAEELELILAEQPLRERSWELLMTARYQAGDPGGALRTFADARATLVAKLGLEPGEGLHRLQQSVLSRDRAMAPMRLRRVPHQLPRPPTALLGRDTELAAIHCASTDGSVLAIYGSAGMGSSALAIQAAHDLSGRYADGLLYADLRWDPSRTAPAVARFLQALGARTVPEDLSEAADLLSSTIADRNMLVLLDNAGDEEQVRLLSPTTPNCLTLVATRRTLGALEGVRSIGVHPLPTATSTALLARFAARTRIATEPESAARIAELCEWMPLALRIAGARIAARPQWSLSDFAALLADEDRRLEILQMGGLSVRDSILASCGFLDPAAVTLLQLLARADMRHATAVQAASLNGCTPAEAGPILERLVEAGLLTSPTPATYRLSDLTRLAAARAQVRPSAQPSAR